MWQSGTLIMTNEDLCSEMVTYKKIIVPLLLKSKLTQFQV